MEWLDAVVAVGLGFLLRLGIPILITIILVRFLRRLDERWQVEAEVAATPVKNIGCWEIKECPHELRETCKAYLNPETPCWQVFRDPNGDMKEGCLGCKVFRDAPIAVPITLTK